jgi:hypothetical protein
MALFLALLVAFATGGLSSMGHPGAIVAPLDGSTGGMGGG